MIEVIRWKKSSSVQTAEVIHLKKILILANKIFIHKKTMVIHSEKIVVHLKKNAAVWTDCIHWTGSVVVRTANVTSSGKKYSAVRAAAAIRSHKTNQSFDRPMVSDGSQALQRLGYLFRRNLIQPSEWLCSFKTNIQPFRFKWPLLSVLKEKLFKITVQEINTLIRCHNGSCYVVLQLFWMDYQGNFKCAWSISTKLALHVTQIALLKCLWSKK